jgi:hypothetical protein
MIGLPGIASVKKHKLACPCKDFHKAQMLVQRRGTPQAIKLETVALSFTADCVSEGKTKNKTKNDLTFIDLN